MLQKHSLKQKMEVFIVLCMKTNIWFITFLSDSSRKLNQFVGASRFFEPKADCFEKSCTSMDSSRITLPAMNSQAREHQLYTTGDVSIISFCQWHCWLFLHGSADSGDSHITPKYQCAEFLLHRKMLCLPGFHEKTWHWPRERIRNLMHIAGALGRSLCFLMAQLSLYYHTALGGSQVVSRRLESTNMAVRSTGFGPPFPFPACKCEKNLDIVEEVEPELG